LKHKLLTQGYDNRNGLPFLQISLNDRTRGNDMKLIKSHKVRTRGGTGTRRLPGSFLYYLKIWPDPGKFVTIFATLNYT